MMGITKTENVLRQLDYTSISFQMTDEHAHYFDAKRNGLEVEVKVVHETGEVAIRDFNFTEDWTADYYIEEEFI